MSFLDSLENLRRSPVEKRRVVLVIFVIIGMAVAIGIWILQLRYTAPDYISEGKNTKPFEFVFESIRNTFDTVKENIRSIYERK